MRAIPGKCASLLLIETRLVEWGKREIIISLEDLEAIVMIARWPNFGGGEGGLVPLPPSALCLSVHGGFVTGRAET